MRRKASRFIYMVVVGIIISLILETVAVEKGGNRFFGFLTSIIITIFVWEGNLRIDDWLNLKLPWERNPVKRILIQLPLTLVFSSITIYYSMLLFNKYVCEFPAEAKDKFVMVAVIIGMLVSIILLSIEIGAQFFGNWKRSLVEVEKYKTESLQAQLQNLKDQINPHFMFNNLSVLSSLVYKDQDKAVDFINQLAKVYRYVLDSRNSELLTLREELLFMESYLYLLQIRFDTSLKIDMEIDEPSKNLMLPPLALQMLIENAIKHNEVSEEFPLKIQVKIVNNKIEVSNNLQLRRNPEVSCKTGLKNIKERYKYFSDNQVEIEETKTKFIVRLPLLKAK
jgi:two-component system, LytTR family, sensor kinase